MKLIKILLLVREDVAAAGLEPCDYGHQCETGWIGIINALFRQTTMYRAGAE
jgi:hypothetical protein